MPSNPSPGEVKDLFKKLNSAKCVRNQKETKVDFKYVICMQVHNRSEYLVKSIESIEQQTNKSILNEILFVVSHNIYNHAVFKAVENIKKFKVIQIGFEYSLQIYNNTFPGKDPNDCPAGMSEASAQRVGCGRRSASTTTTKHHWWWKV
ncbi:alpha-1,6-mannosyl-glycoprotein 2-beta-N-acetylglucosaminyltransferase-like [Convolutriloba macropyga]|uniref:alpha-1,6-mannosyl-glycoprotein 2-beta-N-acetylglucosaminyltransferase-like n=1 Tax=Convolutriloba macropyga TaxID=536237 RepID=UPI003F5263A3